MVQELERPPLPLDEPTKCPRSINNEHSMTQVSMLQRELNNEQEGKIKKKEQG